jgi:hypothetical protein
MDKTFNQFHPPHIFTPQYANITLNITPKPSIVCVPLTKVFPITILNLFLASPKQLRIQRQVVHNSPPTQLSYLLVK